MARGPVAAWGTGTGAASETAIAVVETVEGAAAGTAGASPTRTPWRRPDFLGLHGGLRAPPGRRPARRDGSRRGAGRGSRRSDRGGRRGHQDGRLREADGHRGRAGVGGDGGLERHARGELELEVRLAHLHEGLHLEAREERAVGARRLEPGGGDGVRDVDDDLRRALAVEERRSERSVPREEEPGGFPVHQERGAGQDDRGRRGDSGAPPRRPCRPRRRSRTARERAARAPRHGRRGDTGSACFLHRIQPDRKSPFWFRTL